MTTKKVVFKTPYRDMVTRLCDLSLSYYVDSFKVEDDRGDSGAFVITVKIRAEERDEFIVDALRGDFAVLIKPQHDPRLPKGN